MIEIALEKTVIWQILEENIDSNILDQLKAQLVRTNSETSIAEYIKLFSRMTRIVDRKPITFSSTLHDEMVTLYPGFDPLDWYNDQVLRIYAVINFPLDKRQTILKHLFSVADMKEQVALYKGIYFLEDREKYVSNFTEGIRTNMTNVFDSIALNNPYPSKYLDDQAWNQMVLKAFFMERTLFRITGVDERKNSELAAVLMDYARERWAANRVVSPELWRMVASYVVEDDLHELITAIEKGTSLEQIALSKAIKESDVPQGHFWLKENNLFHISDSETWDSIGVSYLHLS